MRLWHVDLIKYLPEKQLLGQWRELNSIYVKQDKHILINFIYEYEKVDLLIYSQFVLKEMQNRGYKFNLKNYLNYFSTENFDEDDLSINPESWICVGELFEKHMDYEYLKICCWNLWEKYLRGQKGFSHEAFMFITEVIYSERIF